MSLYLHGVYRCLEELEMAWKVDEARTWARRLKMACMLLNRNGDRGLRSIAARHLMEAETILSNLEGCSDFALPEWLGRNLLERD